MSRIPVRWDGEGECYFVTIVTKHRRPLFSEDRNCNLLMDAFREVYPIHPFRLSGLVIMPDHWHGIIEPKEGEVIENVVGAVKKGMLRKYHGQSKGASIWLQRFLDRRIRNQREFEHYLNYIHINPVKHEFADTVDEWPWCFFLPDLKSE